MKRLLCRIAEYHLALCEDEIETRLPAWVKRHLQACPRCQREAEAYARTREAMRQFSRLLPDAPPLGWRGLQVERAERRRAFPVQIAVAAMVVVVALVGAAVWRQPTVPEDTVATAPTPVAPQVAQQPTLPPKPQGAKASPPAVPNAKPKPAQPVREQPPPQTKPSAPAPQEHHAPAHHPPRRVVVASQPAAPSSAHEPSVEIEELPEPEVPIQPVVVEARPVASAIVPEGYVMQSAYPAGGGMVE